MHDLCPLELSGSSAGWVQQVRQRVRSVPSLMKSLFPALSPETRKLRIDEQWMRGAELVVVKVAQGGTIAPTLEIPRLQVTRRGAQ